MYGILAYKVFKSLTSNHDVVTICIFTGTDITNAEEVAIKLECVKTKHPQLHIESKIYKMMQGGGKSILKANYQHPTWIVLSSSVEFFYQL